MANKLREVMGMARLSSTARLGYLWIRWTSKDGVSYATSADLCERIGVTDETITNIARELEAANLVRREAGGKGSGVNKRWVILPLLVASIFGEPTLQATALSPGVQTIDQNRLIIKTQKSRPRRRRKKKAA